MQRSECVNLQKVYIVRFIEDRGIICGWLYNKIEDNAILLYENIIPNIENP